MESTLYTKVEGRNLFIMCLYVDDIIFISTSDAMIDQFKNALIDLFEMSDLGEMNYFFNMQVKESSSGILITQSTYIKDLLNHFNM